MPLSYIRVPLYPMSSFDFHVLCLYRPEYYTIPSIKELNKMDLSDGKCLVENFIVGREDYGEVKFLGTTDVKDLDLDKIGKRKL